MAKVFTILIEGDKNPNEGEVYLRLAKARDFFGECEVTFYGRDSKTSEPVQHSFLIWGVGRVPKSMNRLKIEGCYRIADERPSVLIEEYDFSKKTGTMTYTLPKTKPGEVMEDTNFNRGLAVA